jgi:hypothetical protein
LARCRCGSALGSRASLHLEQRRVSDVASIPVSLFLVQRGRSKRLGQVSLCLSPGVSPLSGSQCILLLTKAQQETWPGVAVAQPWGLLEQRVSSSTDGSLQLFPAVPRGMSGKGWFPLSCSSLVCSLWDAVEDHCNQVWICASAIMITTSSVETGSALFQVVCNSSKAPCFMGNPFRHTGTSGTPLHAEEAE